MVRIQKVDDVTRLRMLAHQTRDTALNCKVPADLKDMVRQYAQAEGVSDADIVRLSLIEFFERRLLQKHTGNS